MTLFRTDWTAGAAGHPDEHNMMAHRLNRVLYVRTTDSLQAAVDRAISDPRPIELAPGVHSLPETLHLSNTSNLVIRGYGATLRAAADMPTLIDMNGAAYCFLEGLRVDTAAGVTVGRMIHLRWDGTVARSTTQNVFRDLDIRGTYSTGIEVGEPNSTLQCDGTRLDNVRIVGDWQPGEDTLWQRGLIVGSNTFANNLAHMGTNLILARHKTHVDVRRTNLSLYHVVTSLADIDILAEPLTLTIDDYRSEGGARLLKVSGTQGYAAMTALRNVYTSPFDGTNAMLPADGVWIEYSQSGSLLLDNVGLQYAPDGIMPKIDLRGIQSVFCHARALSVSGYGTHPVSEAFITNGFSHVMVDGYFDGRETGAITDYTPHYEVLPA